MCIITTMRYCSIFIRMVQLKETHNTNLGYLTRSAVFSYTSGGIADWYKFVKRLAIFSISKCLYIL